MRGNGKKYRETREAKRMRNGKEEEFMKWKGYTIAMAVAVIAADVSVSVDGVLFSSSSFASNINNNG